MVHKRSISHLEHAMRTKQNFQRTESQLPGLRRGQATDKRPNLVQDVFSCLGSYNLLGEQISDNDTAEFVAAVFDKDTGLEVSTVVADIAEKVGLGEGDKEKETIKERLMPFMQSILPGRIVNVEFGGVAQLKLGPGGRNAISSDVRNLPSPYKDGDVITSFARVPKETNGILKMATAFAEPEGWGVISDIDDTIKITQTSDPIGILRSTFVSLATPIEGMPELYTYMQGLVTKSAPFFYLSASPYNIYSFLREFRERHYPQGILVLRDASWRNLAGLLSNLTLGTQDYKVNRMVKINSWIPKRKMICIGDSTQSDPEAYGEIYNKFPGWVHVILIRKVIDIAAIGIEEKNEPKRFEKAFKGVPKNVWHVFESPEECYDIIKSVVAKDS